MNTSENNHELHDNLAALRRDSVSAISALVVVIGYIWLWFDIWPVTGSGVLLASWIGPILLLLSGIIAYRFRKVYLHLATHLLVLCILTATTCAAVIFQSSSIIYLFLLPVIFASVLLSLRSVVFITTFISLIVLVINLSSSPVDIVNAVLLPVGIIGLTAFALWLSAHNLHTTLAWFYNAYQDADRNERLAREREGELRRLFRALDDATFRLERLNYSLTLERNQAREAHRLKQQFAQTISHELRTPLNLIVAFTELMAQSPEYYGASLPTSYVRDLSIVHRNAQHLQNLVTDVLDLARIEAAQMTIIPEPTDPSTLVQEAINTARSLIERRGLTLEVQVEPNLPQLWIDPMRIRQVLFNLLSNAVRFTDTGSVCVRVQGEDKEIIFSVKDTGIGIAAEDMPRLFQDFQQLDGTTRRRHGGAGLGLAISRRFVELHKGRIWVESQENCGSTFYFSLPVSDHQPDTNTDKYNWKLHNNKPASAPMNHNILLAVTGNPAALDVLTRHTHDYRTVLASSLESARIMARDLLPQCILIDTTYEKVDIGNIQQLAEAWDMPYTPFMAFHLPSYNPATQALNVSGYLVKPFSIQKLNDILREFAPEPRRVLVIDDDQDFVRLLSRYLSAPHYHSEVIGAYNGRDGLALLQSIQPDLILVDVNLPEWTGTELVNAIRSQRAGRQTPIIAVMAAR